MGVERRWNPPPAAVPPSSVGMKRAQPPGHLRASEGVRPTIFLISISTIKKPVSGTIFSVVRRPPSSCLVLPRAYCRQIYRSPFDAYKPFESPWQFYPTVTLHVALNQPKDAPLCKPSPSHIPARKTDHNMVLELAGSGQILYWCSLVRC
jgi:hypothetical protein